MSNLIQWQWGQMSQSMRAKKKKRSCSDKQGNRRAVNSIETIRMFEAVTYFEDHLFNCSIHANSEVNMETGGC